MAMTTAVDQVDDVSRSVLHKISCLVDVPHFVKQASADDADSVQSLQQTVFADPVNRKFPCHTKSATWLSQLYFLESRHLYPKTAAVRIQDKIDKAADYWGIGGQVKEATQKWAAHNEWTLPKLTDADYAMVVTYGDGQVARKFPINNPVNVKAAAAHLFSNRSAYPYEWRLTAARKILHKKAEHGVALEPEVDEYLSKAAGFGTMPPQAAAEKLAARVLMIPKTQPTLREKGAQLAKAVAAGKTLPASSDMVKLARIVDRLDDEVGLRKYYDEGSVDTPEEMFFGMTEKVANEIRHGYVELTTGAAIPFSLLQQIPMAKVAAAMGEDFARAVTADNSLDIDLEKFAQIASTLPRPDAQLLEQVINASVKEAGAAASSSTKTRQGAIYDQLSDKQSAEDYFSELGRLNQQDYRFSTALAHPQNVDPSLR